MVRRTRCTANPARQANGYRPGEGGQHRSAPVRLDLTCAFPLPANASEAYLTEAVAPWPCSTYLHIRTGEDEVFMPVDVIQVDDGWHSGIGDWLTLSGRFSSLEALTERIVGTGLRTGIWVAPFLVGARSRVFAEHPEWLIPGTRAGNNWDQDTYGLDATHPGARDYLRRPAHRVPLRGRADPRHHRPGRVPAGLRCADPAQRPSVRCDAGLRRRGAALGALDGDPAQPSQQGAVFSTVGRAFRHGQFWVNDPDCIVGRPAIERREEWADVVDRYGGLRISSDRIADPDDWGLATTRRLLETTPPPVPFS